MKLLRIENKIKKICDENSSIKTRKDMLALINSFSRFYDECYEDRLLGNVFREAKNNQHMTKNKGKKNR